MTQLELVLRALRKGDRLTPLDALNRFGCQRLAGRIWELRKAGHRIIEKMVKVRNRLGDRCYVAEYFLDKSR
jgi:hypothetical protein